MKPAKRFEIAYVLVSVLLGSLRSAMAQEFTLPAYKELDSPYFNATFWPEASNGKLRARVEFCHIWVGPTRHDWQNTLEFRYRRKCFLRGKDSVSIDFGGQITYRNVSIGNHYAVFNTLLRINRIDGERPDGVAPEINDSGVDLAVNYTARGEFVVNDFAKQLQSKLGSGFAISEGALLDDSERGSPNPGLYNFQGVGGNPKQPDMLRAIFKTDLVEDLVAMEQDQNRARAEGKPIPLVIRPNLELKEGDILLGPEIESSYPETKGKKSTPLIFQRRYQLTHIEPANEAQRMPAWIVLQPIPPAGFEFRDEVSAEE